MLVIVKLTPEELTALSCLLSNLPQDTQSRQFIKTALGEITSSTNHFVNPEL